MAVIAHLRNGERAQLAAHLGASPEEIVKTLTTGSLTGSVVHLTDAWLSTEDGGMVRYGEITRLVTVEG